MSLIVSNGTAEGTVLYQYTPSEPAGLAFVGLFSVTAISLTILMFWHRTWYFIPMILGGIMEAGGYYGRAWAHNHPRLLKPYVLYLLLTLAAPAFLAATIYMSLSGLIHTLRAAHLSPLNTRFLTTIFVTVDILSLTAFLSGAGMQIATSPKIQSAGTKIVISGLICQILSLVTFVLISYTFHRRHNKTKTTKNPPSPPIPLHTNPNPNTKISNETNPPNWHKHFHALYTASTLLFVRNTFRIAEYTQGHDGPIAHHEAFIYILDAGVLSCLMLVYIVLHPGRLAREVARADKA